MARYRPSGSASKAKGRPPSRKTGSAERPNKLTRKSLAGPGQNKVTWSQKHTDFVIVLESGEALRVHKIFLAENSPVFDAMLSQDFVETQHNQVKIDQFDEETVISFLQYIYADCVKDERTIELLRAAAGPEKHIFKRTGFDPNRFTVDLMGMAHFYEVKDLMDDCAEYLKENIGDDNVMDVWMEAEKCGNETLTSIAIEHLVERPNGKALKDIPGFMDAFQAYDKPVRDLLTALATRNLSLKDANTYLEAKVKQLQEVEVLD